eukprot:scaffold39647_cov18-Tisochrysis_lutea.AAC.1
MGMEFTCLVAHCRPRPDNLIKWCALCNKPHQHPVGCMRLQILPLISLQRSACCRRAAPNCCPGLVSLQYLIFNRVLDARKKTRKEHMFSNTGELSTSGHMHEKRML